MKKNNINQIDKKDSIKKKGIKLIYKSKNELKNNKINYNLRIENYVNNSSIVYTYGIR